MDGVEITYLVWCNICTHRHDIFSCIHTFNHFSTEHYVQYDMCMDTIFLCSKWWYEIYLFAKYLSVLSKRQQELEGAPESTELICCPSFVHLTQQRQPGFKIGTLSVQLCMIHIKIQRYTHIRIKTIIENLTLHTNWTERYLLLKEMLWKKWSVVPLTQ